MTRYFANHALQLFSSGYPVLPAKGKKVLLDDWPTLTIDEPTVTYWVSNGQAACNIGMRCGDASLGMALTMGDVDIYDRDVARKVAASIEQTFGPTVERRGEAPKRGLIYTQSEPFDKIKRVWYSQDNVKHTVEWLGNGQQFIAYGMHPDINKEYAWRDDKSLLDCEPWELPQVSEAAVLAWMDNVLPGLLPADWVPGSDKGANAKASEQRGMSKDERVLLNYKPPIEIDDERLAKAVMSLDPDMEYDNWCRVGMALHHQYDGADIGLALFDDWSKTGSKYQGRNEIDNKWESFGADFSRSGGVVTCATVLQMAGPALKALDREEQVKNLESWVEQIKLAENDYALQDLIENGIAKDDVLTTVELARLEVQIKSRFSEFGLPIPMPQIRKMMRTKSARSAATNTAPMEEWCDGYVWCQFEDKFIHIDTQEAVSVTSFNAEHGRDVKNKWMTPDGFQMQATHVALQELQIPVVNRRMYLPWADTLFEQEGLDYLNRYRPSTVPCSAPVEGWTDLQRDAVARVKDHISRICGKEAQATMQWMAHNVQNPGRKIRWSVLIKGTYGDGKSLLGTILELVMGQANVGKASPKVVNSDFNGWAEGHCVCLLEELRMQGHNRHDVANSLKELHTNDTVTIHRKGLDSYVVANTQNYMAFTNYADAVPIDDSDRRWFVIFSPFNSEEDLNAVGMNTDYFDSLFDAIRNNADALRGWFLDMDLTGFRPNGRAPDSAAKRAMVSAGKHEEDEAIEDLIAAKVVGISASVISTSHLTNQLRLLPTPIEMQGRAVAICLSRMGFIRKEAQIKWRGDVLRVWVKDISIVTNNDAIKTLLDQTTLHETDEATYEIPF